PRMAQRHSLAQGSFWLFDNSRVHVETVSASLVITQPREVAMYAHVFERLQQSAVYRRDARRLVSSALDDFSAKNP
ncbi:MAG TPA: Scr1 family TA system antitoxin-like transcriptional regulator, partial [Streptosporangiaceae bacterium]